ncbi:MAG TPA: glycosyltransferase family 2 protein, partial [Thermodesulfobacteriota bacterium]|nr:glycosyltransferase family 2 protein [Thermodesulfobacteriota bacterium]
MDKRPFFSIVIPTRNRAHLLRYALESALGQGFDDYEVVVSDNSSEDDTAHVVRELGTSGVRYVRTGSPLSMPDHWEFALDHTEGQYITYLCDDDALCPDALERVADAIEGYGLDLLVLGSAVYYSDNWYDAGLRNCVQILPYTGRVERRESRDTLTHLFMCGDTYEAPRMQNSFCHRDIISKIRAESRRLFLLCPDYSFSAFILTAVPRWTYIDRPLRLQGVFAEGIGAATFYNRGNPFQEFVREFRNRNLLERVPLKVPVTTNFIAETLLMVKERVSSRLAGIEIDWERYFIGCWER